MFATTVSACVTDHLGASDPAMDEVTVVNALPVIQHEPHVDFLDYGLRFNATTGTVRFRLTEAPPMGQVTSTYRYWIGFDVQGSGGPEHVDFRMAHTTTYDVAYFVGSNEMGNPDLGQVAVAWDGANATIEFPMALLYKAYGTHRLSLGNLSAAAAGPDHLYRIQGADELYFDWDTGPFEMASVPACEGPAPTTVTVTVTQRPASFPAGALCMVTLAACALAARPRRR